MARPKKYPDDLQQRGIRLDPVSADPGTAHPSGPGVRRLEDRLDARAIGQMAGCTRGNSQKR